MALTNITPVMTSNTTPSPYTASASSVYSSTYDAWKAFNETLVDSNDAWATATNSATGWIKLDFGTPTKIDAITIVMRNIVTETSGVQPKTFILYGSNDDSSFEQIMKIDNQILWNPLESRLYKLPSSAQYRYYRLNITENGGGTIIVIGELKFWQDNQALAYVTGGKASQVHTLSKNSTFNIKSRINDPREGLLGFACDDDNYGTLWLVNNKGTAQIPRAGMMTAEPIFDGAANTISTTYTMTQSYKRYKYLLIMGGTTSGTLVTMSNLIPTKTIILSKTYQYTLAVTGNSSYYYYMTFDFTSETTFKLDDKAGVGTGWTDPAISKIFGLY